jgi:hypothetical protein
MRRWGMSAFALVLAIAQLGCGAVHHSSGPAAPTRSHLLIPADFERTADAVCKATNARLRALSRSHQQLPQIFARVLAYEEDAIAQLEAIPAPAELQTSYRQLRTSMGAHRDQMRVLLRTNRMRDPSLRTLMHRINAEIQRGLGFARRLGLQECPTY